MGVMVGAAPVARVGQWRAFECDPRCYRDAVAGDTAPHWKPDASRIMVRELAETALQGGECARQALGALLDIAYFPEAEVSGEAEALLLDLYERADLPLK